MADHPGVIFKDGPSGRRAALAYGPDSWESIKFLRGEGQRQPPFIERLQGAPFIPLQSFWHPKVEPPFAKLFQLQWPADGAACDHSKIQCQVVQSPLDFIFVRDFHSVSGAGLRNAGIG